MCEDKEARSDEGSRIENVHSSEGNQHGLAADGFDDTNETLDPEEWEGYFDGESKGR